MKIVFDTNIFIAAALKSGLAEDIIELAATTSFVTLITSEEILEELSQRLLSKFDKNKSSVDFYLGKIRSNSQVVEITEKVDAVKIDPDDNKVLECALAGKADLIVSSDQHLIRLKSFRGIGIIHPKTLTWTFPIYFKKFFNRN